MDPEGLRALFHRVRRFTEALCQPLAAEDYVVQSMPDASPVKWHLAHTSWFFETFVLRAGLPGYRAFDERYGSLFNSYYNTLGPQYPRARRGVLSRPTVPETYDYRRHVDAWMERFFAEAPPRAVARLGHVVEVGINHEEQHQELIVTDVKHALASNPLRPAYRASVAAKTEASGAAAPSVWKSFAGGVLEVGHAGGGFSYDNERPRHLVHVEAFAVASRPVTSGEYLEFMRDGGYGRPDLWLSDGWAAKEAQSWRAPLYWHEEGGRWRWATLGGARDVDPREPVCHVSFYEADAYARWARARLPREEEWEIAATGLPVSGNLVESDFFHPRPTAASDGSLAQLFGDVWEWTASPYVAYPGYVPFEGALGEYNGKFMANQMVLRGGSCATPARHVRATYRNFFPPDARWQFSGLRLAR